MIYKKLVDIYLDYVLNIFLIAQDVLFNLYWNQPRYFHSKALYMLHFLIAHVKISNFRVMHLF